MFDWLIDPFIQFAFMRRALAGVVALSLGASPIGVFLVLRRMSLVGDAMAHAILPGAAIGYLIAGLSLPAMTLGGFAAGLIVALLTGLVTRYTRLREDASLASFYIISLAAGVLIISLRKSNVDLLHILFGSILALDDQGLILLSTISSLTLIGMAIVFRPLVIDSLDPEFLRVLTPAAVGLHLVFLMLLVLNLVASFQALGTLLAVGAMMLPAITARFWTNQVTAMLVLSLVLTLISGVGGLLISFHANLPTGPTMILSAGGLYLFSLVFGRYSGLLPQKYQRPHLGG